MNPIVAALIVVGVVFLVGSFMVKDKLSQKDIDQISKMSEEELKIIVEKQVNKAEDTIENTINEAIDDIAEDTKRSMEKETNEKIMAISEYSDTVLESMNKTHNEIMFLYSMLNDKHKELTELAGDLQKFSTEMKNAEESVKDSFEHTASELEEKVSRVEPINEQKMLEAAVEVQETDDRKENNHNSDILNLHNQGMTDIEIAKELGLGLGEVKLVIGLFKEDIDSEA